MASSPSFDSSRLEAIFTDALVAPPGDERSAVLDRACAGDVELRRYVESLLAAHDRADVLLPPPATSAPSASESVGTTIGRYKLLEQIGEGGFGVVFMAEQTSPVRRRVALKVIKLGMDTKQVIARFEAERQALAMMDHPNIAKVFDAGTTESGRPYFVMELVRGIPITAYCDQHQLTPRQRLELFVQVCQAVQHAHQKGIIHRDLKPTNVLITLQDGDKPTPKVIDFGIAKATAGQRLTELTLFTEFRQFIGTPLYMSPEQAEMSAVMDVDTRSDVYSLGVLLYELLTGTTPFDRDRLAKAAYDEVRRIIREEDPPRPSTRLSTLAGQTLTTVSAHRHMDPKKLGQTVRGELDWIVMKALEKDRTRRYETANGFLRDIQRYLTDQPVEACPPSATYRLRKFAYKHRAPLVVAAAFVLLLVVATVVSSWQAIRATRAKATALVEKDRAEKATVTATNVANYLEQMFATATPGSDKGMDYTVRQMLDDFTEGLEGKFDDQPEAEASLQTTIGRAYRALGEGNKAEKHMARAMELRRRKYGVQHPKYADSLVEYAWALREQQNEGKYRLPEAEDDVRAAMTIYRNCGVNGQPILYSLDTLVMILHEQGKHKEAETATNQLVALAHQSSNTDYDSLLADAAMAKGDFADAELLYRRALESELRQPGPGHRWAPWMYVKFSDSLAAQHKFAEALGAQREALLLFRRVRPANHLSVGGTLNGITNILQSARDFSTLAEMFPSVESLSEIESLYRQSATTRPTRASSNDPAIAATRGLAALIGIYNSLSRQLVTVGKTQEAELARQKAIALLESLQTALPDTPELLYAAYPHLIVALQDLDRPREAREMARKLLDLRPKNAESLNGVAWQMVRSFDPAHREPVLAVQLAEQAVTANPSDGNIWNTLGVARYRNGRWKEAIAALEKSMELRKGGDSSDWFFLAMCHWQLGERDAARTWYDKAVVWMEEKQPNNQELRRFRTEAAQLLGLPAPHTAQPTTTSQPTTHSVVE
jgi:serine/threonine protein kinase/Tfp pilus assembly protein PilF